MDFASYAVLHEITKPVEVDCHFLWEKEESGIIHTICEIWESIGSYFYLASLNIQVQIFSVH